MSARPAVRLLLGAAPHVVLGVVCVVMAAPFAWMVLASLKELREVGGAAWLPASPQWGNYAEVLRAIPFARFFANSLLVALWTTTLQVLTSAMAAYAFSRLEWPHRDKVFLLYLATMMLPPLVMMIPNYQLLVSAGLLDTLVGLVLPASFSPFGAFLMRQFMLQVPRSLDEAAMVDGAGHGTIFWDVVLPASRPGLVALAIITFVGASQSLMWPLVVLRSVHLYTLPVGLLFLDSTKGQSTHLVMAAATLSIVPLVALFLVLQRHLVEGIQAGAVKG